MAYLDLIPDIFPLTMPNLATGQTYRSTKFNVSDKLAIGITVKASQALSVALAYGATSDTAAAAGVGGSASLPFMTSATSFASVTGAEGGTYHEIAVPPSARQAQLVISNASGSTVSGATIDAALRVVAYPAAAGGSATTDAGDLTTGTLAAARLPGVLANVDTAAELRAAAALDTTDSPQFTAINLGHASDTTITRVSAGVVAVEGVNVVLANVLTTNGDLLTRTAGVPARLGLGSALQVLRTNAGATALEFATLSSAVTAVCCQLTKTTETVSANTWTDIAFDSEELDTDTMHDNATNNNRAVVPSTGKYLCIANVICNPGGAYQARAALNLNGSRSQVQFFYPTTNAVFNGHSMAWIANMTASQYVGLQLHFANNTYVHGTDNGTEATASTRFIVIKIGD